MVSIRLRNAVKSLNPNNDEHWTQAGLPSVSAVAEAFGGTVTREDIYAVDWTRADAAAAVEAAIEPEPRPMPAPAPPAPAPAPAPEPDVFDEIGRVLARTNDPRFFHNQGLRQMRALWGQVESASRDFQRRWDEKSGA